jgi:hypothetical protein
MDLLKLQQVVTEDIYSKFNVNKTISNSVSETTLLKIQWLLFKWYKKSNLDERLEDIALKIAITLYSVDKSELLTTAAGRIGKVFDTDVPTGVCLALEALGIIEEDSDLMKIYISGSHLAFKTTLKLDKQVAKAVALASCLPPMLVRPNHVFNNYDSGHLTINKNVLLGVFSNKQTKVNLHFINNANSIKFNLNTHILEYLEEPKNPHKYVKVKEAFENMIAVADKAYEYIIANGNEFHLTHNYDARGREYCDNWQINYQGGDYKKSLFHLDKKELMV